MRLALPLAALLAAIALLAAWLWLSARRFAAGETSTGLVEYSSGYSGETMRDRIRRANPTITSPVYQALKNGSRPNTVDSVDAARREGRL